jgi:hypothetical protein
MRRVLWTASLKQRCSKVVLHSHQSEPAAFAADCGAANCEVDATVNERPMIHVDGYNLFPDLG